MSSTSEYSFSWLNHILPVFCGTAMSQTHIKTRSLLKGHILFVTVSDSRTILLPANFTVLLVLVCSILWYIFFPRLKLQYKVIEKQ